MGDRGLFLECLPPSLSLSLIHSSLCRGSQSVFQGLSVVPKTVSGHSQSENFI